ncbi:retron St85 family effector protein [Aeromonas hydrophila]|uniref:retron St85 family effector protein n=1 Tax=Aeromonas hydrophila TaxID=644 RepID=UPI00207CF28B|nr:retron St85 family effector protein [Aeromonas hydrophila]MCO4209367.1 retron St85 family effector protein [Aeromonas hydrophila]
MKHNLKDEHLEIISEAVEINLLIPQQEKISTIFLCGADINDKSKARSKVANILGDKKRYRLLYPEDIFDDLLAGQGKYSLLNLESILAKSVDVIIICPESPGSFAELGAFSNNTELARKMIVLSDKKYKNAKSFINYGPYRLIKESKSGKVMQVKYDSLEAEHEDSRAILRKITAQIKTIKEQYPVKRNIANLLETERFVLPCIYLIENADYFILLKLLMHATEEDKGLCEIALKSSIGSLINNNMITRSGYEYKITLAGYQYVKNNSEITRLDNTRLEIMNVENRRHSTLRRDRIERSARL